MPTNDDTDGINFIDPNEGSIDVVVDSKSYAANYVIEENRIRLTTSLLPDGKRHSTSAPLDEIASSALASHHQEIAKHMLLELIGAAIQKASGTPPA